MGIGSAVKDMMQQNNTHPNVANGRLANDSTQTPARTGSRKLPPGRGPGTSGKPAPEATTEYSGERTRGGNIAGHGTDSAAAHGGSLASTHPDAANRRSIEDASSPNSMGGRNRTSGVHSADQGLNAGSGISPGANNHSDLLGAMHQSGYNEHNARDIMSADSVREDTTQLNPVIQEHIRYLEAENVRRFLERHKHIHRVQHHIQPIHAPDEILPEQIHKLVHPITNIRQVHANEAEDHRRFESQVRQHRDSLAHVEKERTVIDKGTTIIEHTHYHVHHVIQPIIEKKTIDRSCTETIIPIREETHEAPVIHHPITHSPVPLEHFLQHGGILSGATAQEEIGPRVLHTGQYTREVDGVADKLSRELHLGDLSPADPRDQAPADRDGASNDSGDANTPRTGHQSHHPVTTDRDPSVALA